MYSKKLLIVLLNSIKHSLSQVVTTNFYGFDVILRTNYERDIGLCSHSSSTLYVNNQMIRIMKDSFLCSKLNYVKHFRLFSRR